MQANDREVAFQLKQLLYEKELQIYADKEAIIIAYLDIGNLLQNALYTTDDAFSKWQLK